MSSLLKKGVILGYTVALAIIALFPEFSLNNIESLNKLSYIFNISDYIIFIIIKIIFLLFIIMSSIGISLIIYKCASKRTLKFGNIEIELLYGDIFKYNRKCLKVIPFDECYTIQIGRMANQIKIGSLCGQYLTKFPIDAPTLNKLLQGVRTTQVSQYNSVPAFKPGIIVERGEYLLLSFAKLDYRGKGHLSNKEYIDALMTLWDNIDNYSSQYNICVPILGSNITRLDDGDLTKQQLLNVMIQTYMLAPRKIKLPHKLVIICKKSEDFSIWNFKY